MNIHTEQVIDVSDWDLTVETTYGRPYKFQQQEGCRERGLFRFSVPDTNENDRKLPNTIPEKVNGEQMGVTFSAWLARDPKQLLAKQEGDWQLKLWWERNFYPDIQTVANDLYDKGLLAAGDYTIDIDW